MAVKLKPNNVLINVPGEPLGQLDLDDHGKLGLTQQVLQSTVTFIGEAINANHDQVTYLGDSQDEISESLEALKQLCAQLDHRLHECEDFDRDMRIQMVSSGAGGKSEWDDDGDGSAEDTAGNNLQAESVNIMLEKIEAMSERVDGLEHTSQQERTRIEQLVASNTERVGNMQDNLEDNVEGRLNQLEDQITQQKMDVDALRNGLQESDNRFAKRTDLLDLQKAIDTCMQEVQHEKARMSEVGSSLEKLDSAMELAKSNKALLQEMNKKLNEESDLSRQWCSKQFRDLRNSIQTISHQLTEEGPLLELKEEFRNSLHEISQQAANNEQRLKLKAEHSDYIRLRDEVGVFAMQAGRPRQLLVGKRCLACDRETTSEVTDEPAAEIARAYQQEDLFREVHDCLRKAAGNQDVLKYVAVHVGGPARMPGKDGGIFRARDMSDTSPPSHQLVRSPMTTRPNTGGHSTYGSTPFAGELVPGTHPREAPRVVRVPPRKLRAAPVSPSPLTPRLPGSYGRAPGVMPSRCHDVMPSTLFSGSGVKTHHSLKHALGVALDHTEPDIRKQPGANGHEDVPSPRSGGGVDGGASREYVLPYLAGQPGASGGIGGGGTISFEHDGELEMGGSMRMTHEDSGYRAEMAAE